MTDEQLPDQNIPDQDTEYRVVPASNGILWIKRAITLFKRNPAAWLSCSLVLTFSFIFLLLVVVLIPPLFPASFILSSIYLGGLMLGSHQLYQFKEFQVRHLFAGFERNTAALCIIGLIYFAGTFVSSLIGVSFSEMVGFKFPEPEAIQNAMTDQKLAQDLLGTLLLPTLIAMGFLIPVLMAFWFAPAIAVLFEEKPIAAMLKSMKACAVNTLPFLVYGIVATFAILFLSIIASVIGLYIPIFGVFLKFVLQLAFTSILIASIYTSFEDIFPGLNHQKKQKNENDIDQNSNSLIV